MNLAEQLANLPRATLGFWPTPLTFLQKLSEELQGPRIWLKRDDCSGLATGGNKTRKLEYLLGAAKAQGADAVVTFGALQSNHARQTAAAAAVAGLPCHLLLSRQVPRKSKTYETQGNRLFNRIFHAQTEAFDADDQDGLRNALQELRAQYGKLFVIPAGGSNAIGALGYVQAAAEIQTQCQAQNIALSHVLHASSSAGTQAGLIAGFQALHLEQDGAPETAPKVIGFNVYHPDPATLTSRIGALLEDLHSAYPWLPKVASQAIQVNHAYLGEGYGLPSDETLEAIRMVAQMEGILFDPVYSGKALAGMIDQISVGAFRDAEDVVFIHTGGVQALNAYSELF